MHVCFVRQVRLEPEAVKLRRLVGRGEVRGVAKPWRKLKDFDGGKSEDVIVLQELVGVAFLRWDDPPITY